MKLNRFGRCHQYSRLRGKSFSICPCVARPIIIRMGQGAMVDRKLGLVNTHSIAAAGAFFLINKAEGVQCSEST